MQYQTPICLTIGNFDGVHRGHQALLTELKQIATVHQAQTGVLFFEPQPLEFLAPDKAPARIQSAAEKKAVLSDFVDECWQLAFDAEMQHLSPDAFLERYLFSFTHLKAIVVGADFRFGFQRQGDIYFLAKCCEQRNIELKVITDYCDAESRISSTQIRDALAEGQFDRAHALLGRPFTMEGIIEHGDKRGRQIGVPTANIDIARQHSPIRGVFIVNARLNDHTQLNGIANVGTRPTFNGNKTLLEVHLFDFNDTCYEQKLHITFLKKVRDEMQFPDFEALKTQIYSDIQTAKEYFADVKRELS